MSSLSYRKNYKRTYFPFYARGNTAPVPLVSQTKNCSYVMKVPAHRGDYFKGVLVQAINAVGMRAAVQMNVDAEKGAHTKAEAKAFRLYLVDTKGDRIEYSPKQVRQLGDVVKTLITPQEYELFFNHFYEM